MPIKVSGRGQLDFSLFNLLGAIDKQCSILGLNS